MNRSLLSRRASEADDGDVDDMMPQTPSIRTIEVTLRKNGGAPTFFKCIKRSTYFQILNLLSEGAKEEGSFGEKLVIIEKIMNLIDSWIEKRDDEQRANVKDGRAPSGKDKRARALHVAMRMLRRKHRSVQRQREEYLEMVNNFGDMMSGKVNLDKFEGTGHDRSDERNGLNPFATLDPEVSKMMRENKELEDRRKILERTIAALEQHSQKQSEELEQWSRSVLGTPSATADPEELTSLTTTSSPPPIPNKKKKRKAPPKRPTTRPPVTVDSTVNHDEVDEIPWTPPPPLTDEDEDSVAVLSSNVRAKRRSASIGGSVRRVIEDWLDDDDCNDEAAYQRQLVDRLRDKSARVSETKVSREKGVVKSSVSNATSTSNKSARSKPSTPSPSDDSMTILKLLRRSLSLRRSRIMSAMSPTLLVSPLTPPTTTQYEVPEENWRIHHKLEEEEIMRRKRLAEGLARLFDSEQSQKTSEDTVGMDSPVAVASLGLAAVSAITNSMRARLHSEA